MCVCSKSLAQALDVQYIQLPLLISALMRVGLCVWMCRQGFLDAAAFLNFPQGHAVTHTHASTGQNKRGNKLQTLLRPPLFLS